MIGNQAVQLIDRLLEQGQQRKLNDLESTIVLQTWDGSTYREIADRVGYEEDYIKHVAARLWKSLSKLVGEKVSKSNIKAVLRRYRESTRSPIGLNQLVFPPAIEYKPTYQPQLDF
jgi:DNA-directed RNA polymerase specialized sigma24 family protein